MTSWQAPPEALRTVPEWQFHTTPTEVLALEFDTAPLLGAGETASLPKVACLDVTTGQPVTLGAATLEDGVITQVVKGLKAGHAYWLTWGFTIDDTNKPSRISMILCAG